MSFSEEEKAYLLSQSLARVATVSRDGHPDMVPVGFEFNGSDLYVGELDLLSTRKYGNVVGRQRSGRAGGRRPRHDDAVDPEIRPRLRQGRV